jgi:hypothetical protein
MAVDAVGAERAAPSGQLSSTFYENFKVAEALRRTWFGTKKSNFSISLGKP